jgi:hypothetical protein
VPPGAAFAGNAARAYPGRAMNNHPIPQTELLRMDARFSSALERAFCAGEENRPATAQPKK